MNVGLNALQHRPDGSLQLSKDYVIDFLAQIYAGIDTDTLGKQAPAIVELCYFWLDHN